MDNISKLEDIVDMIKVTDENKEEVEEIKAELSAGNFEEVIKRIRKLNNIGKKAETENVEEKEKKEVQKQVVKNKYPKELVNQELEETYIGLLLEDPRSIARYYYVYSDCFFNDDSMLNIYQSILFTKGEAYAPERAKEKFKFADESAENDRFKYSLQKKVREKKVNFEKIFVELKKLFILRKYYLANPITNIQEKIIEIVNYELYAQMSPEEVESAVEQVTTTEKFKRAVLNKGMTNFLLDRDNNLTNGLELPFPILSSVFKGIRKGETMAFAMPSNSGKSRFTINIAAHIAFVSKKKVLIISNEMSEDKMKLCLITTILNNPEIQKEHGQVIKKTEGELLEFKFRPDEGAKANVDEDGFIVKDENESQQDFVSRLSKISSEFNKTIQVTDWLNKQMNNSIYFINITDHTNDELNKVIMNYYYKEQIEYIFYDTLKTDIDNIGNGEELKKTATILSNRAQDFNIYIASTLQLIESSTLPINLNVNDLSASRTVKEVLDTLCLMKQISRDNYEDYEYSLEEVDTKFFELEKFKDPDVRYYACVVDKNRAGAKPTVLFRLNLAYNTWEELGYLKLKQRKSED